MWKAPATAKTTLLKYLAEVIKALLKDHIIEPSDGLGCKGP